MANETAHVRALLAFGAVRAGDEATVPLTPHIVGLLTAGYLARLDTPPAVVEQLPDDAPPRPAARRPRARRRLAAPVPEQEVTDDGTPGPQHA